MDKPNNKVRLEDLDMPYYKSKKEVKEMRTLQVDRLLEEYSKNKDCELIPMFIDLYQQGQNPSKDILFTLTEKVFALLNFILIQRDQYKSLLTFKNTQGNQEIYISFSVDQKNDQISLTGYQFQGNTKMVDLKNQIHKDIISYLTNQINSEIPLFSIDYSFLNRTIQCQTSTIGQLDENYVSWLLINIDAVTIATLETNSAFHQMYKSGSGPNESMIISEKCKNSIRNRVDENKQSYDQLLFIIDNDKY